MQLRTFGLLRTFASVAFSLRSLAGDASAPGSAGGLRAFAPRTFAMLRAYQVRTLSGGAPVSPGTGRPLLFLQTQSVADTTMFAGPAIQGSEMTPFAPANTAMRVIPLETLTGFLS